MGQGCSPCLPVKLWRQAENIHTGSPSFVIILTTGINPHFLPGLKGQLLYE